MGKLLFLPLIALIAASNQSVIPSNKISGGISPQFKLIAAVDGKSFYADWTIRRDYWDAGKYCQEQGMVLASVTSDAQLAALNGSWNYWDFNGAHWMSGGDVNVCNCFYSLEDGSSLGSLPCLLGIGTLCEKVISNPA